MKVNYKLITVILKNSKFSILNKERKELQYAKNVYKKRIQSEADSFLNQEKKPDTIVAQDILYIDRISI
tara:strand:- start:389 stop:595 length:207 start_codon:yes stop_codon:yes gene_type:complete